MRWTRMISVALGVAILSGCQPAPSSPLESSSQAPASNVLEGATDLENEKPKTPTTVQEWLGWVKANPDYQSVEGSQPGWLTFRHLKSKDYWIFSADESVAGHPMGVFRRIQDEPVFDIQMRVLCEGDPKGCEEVTLQANGLNQALIARAKTVQEEEQATAPVIDPKVVENEEASTEEVQAQEVQEQEVAPEEPVQENSSAE